MGAQEVSPCGLHLAVCGNPAGGKTFHSSFLALLFCLGMMTLPVISGAQEINLDGWSIPDLKGMIPYSISFKKADGVEKMTEKFYVPGGGQVARVIGNGRVFAYVVDRDLDPPVDYILIDPDGSGRFTQKFGSEYFYLIPEWVSR
jgi:hypothetical protein